MPVHFGGQAFFRWGLATTFRKQALQGLLAFYSLNE
ncbi:hypothetical protein H4V99_000197 [Cryobacterium sp. CG_9.6]|nr:hypothetical protein [Cryobacterium sp. CG_9.6]